MGRGLVIGRRRVRFRFIFFLVAIAFVFIWVNNLNVKQKSYGAVEYGAVTIWTGGDGLIIRNEKVFNVDEYGKIDYISADGELVEKEDLLAVLYKSNYNKNLIDNLYQIKQKIVDYQKKNIVGDILDSDYNKLEENINNTVQAIQLSIQSDLLDSLEYQEKQLRTLLARRQELLSQKITPDKYLQQLYEKEAELNKQIEEWKIDIVAPDSGIVSFQLDGFEKILNSGSIDYMTIDEFKNLQQSLVTEEKQDSIVVERPLFKLIDPQKWYLVCHIPSTDTFYEKNDVLSVKLLGSSEKALEGVVYKIDRGSDSTLVTLEFSQGIEAVTNIRYLPVEIGKTTEGLLVPASAIIKGKDGTGIEFIYKGETRHMEVKVKAMDDKKAVIEKIGDVEGLNLNDKVVIR